MNRDPSNVPSSDFLKKLSDAADQLAGKAGFTSRMASARSRTFVVKVTVTVVIQSALKRVTTSGSGGASTRLFMCWKHCLTAS